MKISLLLALIVCLASALPGQAKPNLIVINIDDLGYHEIGSFGATNRTPHLDRMAAEGRKLTSHYAAPVCSPSRAALMTGSYPKRALPISHVLFPSAAVGLNPNERTVAELLKDAGYATLCIGKWHLGDQPEFLPRRQGFEEYFGVPYSNDMGPAADGTKSDFGKPLPGAKAAVKKAPKQTMAEDGTGIRGDQPPLALIENDTVIARVRADDQTQLIQRYTDRAVTYIRQHREGRPFFIYFAHSAVHFPRYPAAEFRGKSPNGLLGDWVQEVDWSVGQVLNTLRELKLAQNTFVLFVSDNGGPVNQGANNHPLRGSKGSTLEGGIRVPALAWWPGRIPAGTSTDAITTMMDVLPTLAQLAGAPLPTDRTLDGVDQWPVLVGNPARPPRDSFLYHRGLELEAVRSGPWKLHLAKNELYHLGQDIGEANNVAAQNPDVVQRLRALAEASRNDLGVTGLGPGCRPLGRVAQPQPIIAADGTVRADMAGAVKRFP